MPNDNNGIINRPFADLQERLAEVDRLDRDNALNNRREVDYRGIANFLSGEIFHLIVSTSNAEVKQWGKNVIRKLHERGLSVDNL